jgi:hypothetical protein
MLKMESVSLIGCIMLIKSLLHNVAIVNRITVLFRIFSFQSLFLQGWKELDYDKFSVTSIKKAISEVQRRFCAVDNSEKVKSLVFRPDGPVMVPDTLLCLKDSDKLNVASFWMSRQHVRTLFRVRKDFSFPLQTRIGKTACIRLHDRATRSGRSA